ncbi:Crp/Fnr family transcriptional regulator [Bacillus sp. 2205SS5-2]|uniref:Crp/Fnr family transcriptional regulator n=1 Tax=Bacillus sp. 2205SS5-2 TaxID=3109031 RepID=UPI0030053C2D
MQTPVGIPSEIKNMFLEVNQKRNLEKGSFLFQEGMVASELFFVVKGKFQVSKVIPDGKELSLKISSPGEVLGELTLFCSSSAYMLNAKALETTELLVMKKSDFEEKLASNPHLTLEWLKYVQLQNRKNQTKFRDLILHGKKGALYSTLIRLSNSYGKMTSDGLVIELSLTNQEISNFCGTSREVVNRLLNDLKRENVLSFTKGIITIYRLSYLKKEIDCEECPIEICRID